MIAFNLIYTLTCLQSKKYTLNYNFLPENVVVKKGEDLYQLLNYLLNYPWLQKKKLLNSF